ncbi:hypothetical protein JRQ81_014684 [Phrynocephalus forsythii]|uniref:Uncharacterized protein n=1 Tax=Phrynocephalus forsythii TaxID=171643 RepID=A0A9Q1B3P8_9SAUR|nr:hypothetical protein JRQ81_014684 [Phrynocephalus forsythii]
MSAIPFPGPGFQGGDRQGCRETQFYSLMGEEHCQSNGQSGGKSICLVTHYILLYHPFHSSVISIVSSRAES